MVSDVQPPSADRHRIVTEVIMDGIEREAKARAALAEAAASPRVCFGDAVLEAIVVAHAEREIAAALGQKIAAIAMLRQIEIADAFERAAKGGEL
jgi:hypothetical protein